MAIKQIFKSRMVHINYILRNGKMATFGEDGKYLTDIPDEIAELDREIQNGHQMLYRDPQEKEIDTTLQEEISKAMRNAALDVMEKHNKAKTEPNQIGTQAGAQSQSGVGQEAKMGEAGILGNKSAAQILGVTSTAQLGNLAAGSSSGSVNPVSK